MKVIKIVAFALAFTMILSGYAMAAGPQETLKGHVDNFIGELKTLNTGSAVKGSAGTDKLWNIIEQMFVFEGVARLALGKNWDKFNDAEKKEFTDWFTRLLGNSYLKKIREGYTNQTVEFLNEEMRGDKKAVVSTRIKQEGGDIPVDYSMLAVGGQWRVYDVKIEGVSLVKNYRAQFDEMLMNKKPADVIERVKAKVKQQESGQDSGDDSV